MQYQKPILKQELKLKMSPQLYQAIKLMSLPILDLRERIQEEIENNPALEIVEDNSTVSLDDMNDFSNKSADEYEYFEETSDSGFLKNQKREDQEDFKRKFMEGTLSRPESLQEHLLWQLRLQPISKEQSRIGEMLISNLNNYGFHIQPPENIVKKSELGIMASMVKMIQTFDPIGVCTADYQEALLVQIENHPDPVKYSYQVVDQYLKLLNKEKYREIAGKLNITEEEVKQIAEFIKTLEPFPGRNFESSPPQYVIPDLMIKLKNGEFVLILNDEEIPVLGINPFFTDYIDKKNNTNEKEINSYVHERLRDARYFIQSIIRRNETLLKTCKAIIEFQRNFFRKGPKFLAPLTLKDIAQEVKVSEATVSRITRGKYIQTEWGIFELKHFFSNPVSSSGIASTTFSKAAAKQIIKEIIESESDKTHLTDSKIVKILESRGIKIARRTVAKYRNELDIMSSYNR